MDCQLHKHVGRAVLLLYGLGVLYDTYISDQKGILMVFKGICHRAAILFLSFSGSIAFSTTPDTVLQSIVDVKQYKPLVTLTIGPDFVQPGQAQALTLLPPFENYYTNNSQTATVADGGGFFGVERTLSDYLAIQLGVAGYVDAQLRVQGDVWQFGLPLFDTLGYSYNIHHSRVMFSSKLLTTMPRYESLHPYFSWELGTAYNRASNYGETPLIDLAIPMAPFTDYRKSSFAWGLGVGFDYNLNEHIRAGVGYQFANLGSVSLGVTPSESTRQTLGSAHLYTNQLRFQLTFLV